MADYYQILGLSNRNCDEDAIRKAYRQNALKWHPDKHIQQRETATSMFELVSRAYLLLCDKQARAIYDVFGEQGLTGGVPEKEGKIYPGWIQSLDADGVFLSFFGVSSPFAVFSDDVVTKIISELGPIGGLKAKEGLQQPPPVVIPLECTMGDLYNGFVRKVPVEKNVMNNDQSTTRKISKVLTVTVKAGTMDGTIISFPKEGDESPCALPPDIHFVVKQQPSTSFERQGNDLIYHSKISLLVALTGGKITVSLFDGREINVPINTIITPGDTKTVVGEGFPAVNNKNTRGNLIVKFQLIFPKKLSVTQKEEIKSVFKSQPIPHPVHNRRPVQPQEDE